VQASPAMPSLDSLRLFDSCVTLGRLCMPGMEEFFSSADELLAMMDRYHIAEALVHQHAARTVYPWQDGNRRLLEAIAGQPRLHPVWVIEPPKQPGAAPARQLVAEMLDAGVRAARLTMRRARPLPWVWDDLLGALEGRRVPCFLDFGDESTRAGLTDGEVNAIREMALAHPNLPLIFSHIMGGLGVHYGVVPLIRQTSNVCLDITGILQFWREVALEVGPQRVLFATGAPFVDPGILGLNIQCATGFDDAAKGLMAGGNLRRLLEDVR